MKLSDHILRKPLYVAFGQALQGGGITSVDLVAVRDATTVTLTASDGSAAPIAGADASTAGVMTADDKSKLDGLSSAATHDFATTLDVAASVIDAGFSHLRTAGQSAVGDGGGSLYKRAASEPTHALKIQSVDTAWWEIVPENGVISAIAIGLVEGDSAALGAANVTAFNNFITYAQLVGNLSESDKASAPTLFFPEGHYHFNTHLNIKAAVHLLGTGGWTRGVLAGARLVFPADSYGLIVHAKNTLDSATVAATFSANGTIIERLSLTGGGTSGTTGSGIWMRGQAFVRDCRITAFAENGVKIRAGIGGGLDTEGNANLWRLEGVLCEANGKDGIFVNGADVNAGYCIGADCRNNGRWGIFDSSFLGNTYMACHTNLNGVAGKGGNPAGSSSRVEQGGNIYEANQNASEAALVATSPGTDESVWILVGAGNSSSTVPTWLSAQAEGTYFHGGCYCTDSANARNIFLGCYREGNQNRAQFVSPTEFYSGSLGDPQGSATGFNSGELFGAVKLKNNPLHGATRDILLSLNADGTTMMRMVADGDHSKGHNIIAWNESDKTLVLGQHANLNGRRPIQITSDLSTLTFNRSSAVDGGFLWLKAGAFIGPLARYFEGFRLKPTGGEYARGDMIWNAAPKNPGEAAGWRVTTGGTIGTNAVLEEFFYAPDLPSDRGAFLRPHASSTKVEWRAAPKAGTDTIADTSAIVTVTFATAFANANYAVALSADGDERIWVTAKAATGFTLNRLATAGARAVDWTVTPHEDL